MKLVTGLEPLSDRQLERQKAVCAAANPYRVDYAMYARDSMPVAAWSSEFEDLLESRYRWRVGIEAQGKSVHPWDIFLNLPEKQKRNNIYAWNQGSRPSCSCHGAAHAFQASALYQIRRYVPLVYDAVNPIYSFYLGKNGSYFGGLDVQTTSEVINEIGFFPVSAVGDDNITATQEGLKKKDVAANHQAGIVRIESDYVERIFLCCRGMFSVAFGASGFYSSAREIDGVRQSASWSGGGHMQAFTSWKKIGNTEFVFCQNSHGEIYGSSGTEPQSGSWCDKEQVERYSQSFATYGYPLVIFAEGDLLEEEKAK